MAEHDLNRRESIHFQILRILEGNPNCTQRELAEQLGVSLGRVNYCLRALIERGSMKVENFKASQNRWGYLYVLTPQGFAERSALTGRFLLRKLQEFEVLRTEIEALQREHPDEAASLDISLASPARRERAR